MLSHLKSTVNCVETLSAYITAKWSFAEKYLEINENGPYNSIDSNHNNIFSLIVNIGPLDHVSGHLSC